MNDGELDGLGKAAVLLCSLPQSHAQEILRRLEPQARQCLRRQMEQAGAVPPQVRDAVIWQFCSEAQAQLPGAGGEDRDDLLANLSQEHPRTIALMLSRMPAAEASILLNDLPTQKRIEVVKRIADPQCADSRASQEIERGLEERLSRMMGQVIRDRDGGSVHQASDSAEQAKDDAADTEAPKLHPSSGSFARVALLDESSLRALAQSVDRAQWALALKTSGLELRERILRGLPTRNAQWISDKLQSIAPVRVSDVEAAQQKIIIAMHRLSETGQIAPASGAREQLPVEQPWA